MRENRTNDTKGVSGTHKFDLFGLQYVTTAVSTN